MCALTQERGKLIFRLADNVANTEFHIEKYTILNNLKNNWFFFRWVHHLPMMFAGKIIPKVKR